MAQQRRSGSGGLVGRCYNQMHCIALHWITSAINPVVLTLNVGTYLLEHTTNESRNPHPEHSDPQEALYG
jgi:hypothetical protein